MYVFAGGIGWLKLVLCDFDLNSRVSQMSRKQWKEKDIVDKRENTFKYVEYMFLMSLFSFETGWLAGI